MNLEQFLEYIKGNKYITDNITHWKVIPSKAPQYANFPNFLDDRLIKALKKRGIEHPYSHQRESWDKVNEGKHIVVVTPTASGKTLCYNGIVINEILKNPTSCALYIFPTKALSQDQVKELQEIVDTLDVDIKTYTYDGDTPTTARRTIRKTGHIVVTNPDMLHTAILPHHTKWMRLFENLKYVVIDEIHHYRGVFGSHVSNVLRRLKRVCNFYGSSPQFICASATIKNPTELATKIIGEEVSLIDQNGAPSGEKHFIFYNPPVVNRQLGIRKSALLEAKNIASSLIKNEIQTIVFTRTRLSCEILTTYLKEALKQKGKNKVRGYRGGYLPKLRRSIEKGLKQGEVIGVVSTNALELGIDIGSLEASVICGYPGTISSTWQQAGRAGRRSSTSAVFLIATSSPLDQFIIYHPEYFFGNNIESALVNPDNIYILLNHIKCASFELPFKSGDVFGESPIEEILEFLEEERILHKSGNTWYWSADSYPAEDISLRSADVENFVVIDITEKPKVIGEVDRFTAPMVLHPEAIYIHESRQYQVEKLDFENKKAYVRSVDVDYYTDANLEVNLKVLSCDMKEGDDKRVFKYVGDVQVNAMVSQFKKIKFHTHENIGTGPVNLPEMEMHTTAYWISFGESITKEIPLPKIKSGIIGISNLLSNIAPVYLMCDPADIHCTVHIKSPYTEKPTIFLYDGYPGGIGLSERMYNMHKDLLKSALELVEKCTCLYGCPSCVGPASEIGLEGKEIALKILKRILKEKP